MTSGRPGTFKENLVSICRTCSSSDAMEHSDCRKELKAGTVNVGGGIQLRLYCL